MADSPRTAVFDVDGTLVDSNYQHALAWFRAFRGVGVTLPVWRIHRALGMGGDQLIAAVAGDEVEEQHGDEIREAWVDQYAPLLPEVRALEGATELLRAVKDRGLRVVLASSSQPDQMDHYLDLLGARDLADAWTTSQDVEKTKPAPDLVAVAIERVDGGAAVMVGDSPWDAVAAGKLDIPTIAVRTGGFSVEELRDAGATTVVDSLVELREQLDDSPLGTP